jgi:uncharacterized membrane protein
MARLLPLRCRMLRDYIELAAQMIEVMGAGIIVIALAHATGRYLFHIQQRATDAYDRFKVYIGKALLLGLEFLVAADIVRTVVLESTMENVAVLGLLVVVRTFLSWSVILEIEGRWPWQARGEEERP